MLPIIFEIYWNYPKRYLETTDVRECDVKLIKIIVIKIQNRIPDQEKVSFTILYAPQPYVTENKIDYAEKESVQKTLNDRFA